MAANYSHTNRPTGTVVTDVIYNGDHNNHITNMIPTIIDDYSSNATTMRTTADPYPGSVESLATALSGEIERIRYMIQQITGLGQWYHDTGTHATLTGAETITNKTSITSAAFVGPLTGEADTVATITGLAPDTATTAAAQPNITSLGTLTTLTVDDITINGNTISSGGASTLAITPTAGQVITLDGTITVDAGVVAGATSITSTAFVGALTGQADTVATITGLAPDTATTQATQAAITSLGTLSSLNVTANVGIGILAPATNLQVVDTSTGVVTTPLLLTNRTTANDTAVQMGLGAIGSDDILSAVRSTRIGSGDNDLSFWNWDGSALSQRVTVGKEGHVGVGIVSATGKLHVDQSSATGALPVLHLDQADVSEEMIEFTSVEGVGNAIEDVGAKVITVTEFIKITVNGAARYFPCGTIA